MLKRTTLTDTQKFEFCIYARDNKRTCSEYDQKLSNEVTSPEAKHHKAVAIPELELAFKEFILIYQNRTILSDAMIVEKTKLLAEELGVSEGKLHFLARWLQKFKEQNEIRQIKLYEEASSIDKDIVTESLPLLQNKYTGYSLDRIYNIDKTGLFYRLELDRTLATQQIAECKKDKKCFSVALCANADEFHKLSPLIIGKYTKSRCFKNIKINNLHMTYRNNTKAWMLVVLFQE
ncbi:13940_t:CDS:2 [Dentiscutata heterogama]|uniref:13940_t:CDS:1 n=1 Tax=Dentiscutata heterogama TaxID=1316150 RepID=A0ACA9MAI7_9GLOM|nr:13940_t:CDS:2 [Dentiscutata heterogama]